MDGNRRVPTSSGISGSLFDPPQQQADRSASLSGSNKSLVAHIDGGARGNPGPAGYGVHLTDDKGKLVAEISRYLGHRTNNFAEYSALIAALEYAVEHGWSTLKVISDSELLVKQIHGDYKVKSPDLKELYDRARILIRKLERFSIQHVLRAQNRDADRLANWAMDNPGLSETAYLHGTKAARSTAPLASAVTAKEFEGVVRAGKVELIQGELPEGTKVKVIPIDK